MWWGLGWEKEEMCFVRSLCPSPCLQSTLLYEVLSFLSRNDRSTQGFNSVIHTGPSHGHDQEGIFIVYLSKPLQTNESAYSLLFQWAVEEELKSEKRISTCIYLRAYWTTDIMFDHLNP